MTRRTPGRRYGAATPRDWLPEVDGIILQAIPLRDGISRGWGMGTLVFSSRCRAQKDPFGWASVGDRVDLILHLSLFLILLSFPLLSREWFPSYLLAPERISAMLRLCWNITSPTCRYPSQKKPGRGEIHVYKGTKDAGG